MIASFSKQSVRFFQQVVGPVFDLGGALTGTYNAATFGAASQSTESRIQAAINQAAIDGIKRVYVPSSMYPYSASSMSFIYTVQMVREGGESSVYDAWAYGASPLGVRSAISALQGMINSVATTGGVAVIPAGNYSITTTLLVRGLRSLKVVGLATTGQSPSGVQITWNGPNLGRALLIDASRDCVFEDIGIYPGTGTLDIGIDIDNISNVAPFTTNNSFRRVHVDQCTTASVRIAHSSPSVNCDLNTFENCQIFSQGAGGQVGDGVRIENGQSKFNKFIGGSIANRTYGIHTIPAGSIECYQTNFSANSIDVKLANPTDAMTFVACQSEGAQRFLVTDNSGAAGPISLIGCRLAPDSVHADGIYIDHSWLGPLMLSGNDWAGGISYPSVRYRFQGGVGTHVMSQGNIFPNATPFTLANGATYVSLQDAYVTSGATMVLMPSRFVATAMADAVSTPTEAVLVSGVNALVGNVVGVTLTANRIVGAPTTPTAGQRLGFTFTQDATGGWAVSWNAVFKIIWSDAGNGPLKRSSVACVYDGTNWNQTEVQTPYV
jgi:hypothetical protein